MSRKHTQASLPTPRQLKERAKKTMERLTQLFARPELKQLSGYAALGLCRIEEKLEFALLLAGHMQQRNITSVDELAFRLFIGSDHIEVLEWMRSPTAFKKGRSQKRDDEYLLALCGIEWNPHTKSFFFSGSSA